MNVVIRSIAALAVLCLLAVAVPASAQTVIYDSINGTVLASFNVDNADYAAGAPNNQQARIRLNGLLVLGFQLGGHFISMDEGSTLTVHWNRETQDSIAGMMRFQRLNPNGVLLSQSDSILVNHPGANSFAVPAGGYNALEFTLTGGTDLGSTYFYLDAVTLHQHGTAGVSDAKSLAARLSVYPNPFLASSGTNVHITSTVAGSGTIVISDLLGRTIRSIDVGAISNGEQDVRMDLDEQGVYVGRLLVNGQPVGEPFKISAH